MSIYLERSKLKRLENYLNLKIDDDTNGKIVASGCKKKLYFKDYTEEKLETFVKKYENCKVNYIFWNYNYCTLDNLSLEDIEEILNKLKINEYKDKQFVAGYIISIINFYNILFKLYNNSNFDIDEIKLDKKNFKHLLIDSNDKYIVSDKFSNILHKVFNEDDIHHYLLKENNYVSLEEFEIMLKKIKVNNLDNICEFIFKYIQEFELKLNYINILLDNCDKIDYSEEYVFIDDLTLDMGFMLINMELPDGQLTQSYIDTVNKYINTKGPLKFTYSPNFTCFKEKVDKRIKLI